ncbi:hypothetical protein [Aeromonas simiae]|uniref:hypothetical protein n=1 Tax=Aeromonas simiae TaxID=218936 RepID=UPI000693CE23|nr:hypothetical protein [Aeromonas simiae]
MTSSITSAGSSGSLAQLWQTNVSQTQNQQTPPPPPPGGDSKMQEDVMSALSDAGIDTSHLTEEQSDSLTAFMQTLMETLHQQGAAQGQESAAQESPMQRDLQSLLGQLTGSSESSSSSTDELQGQFSSLLDSLGASESGVTLQQFLSAFSGKMENGRSEPGYFVNTSA